MMNDEIVLPGIGKIKVRRGKNIRFLSVRIAPGRGVWVNVPFGVSGRQVEEFVHTQRDWIVQNLAKIKVYEKDTGVGLGMDSEVKTKFHVLKVLACDELRPYYKIEGNPPIYSPWYGILENCSLRGEFFGRDLSYGE